MEGYKLKHDERVLESYAIPEDGKKGKLDQILPVIISITTIVLIKFMLQMDHEKITDYLQDFNFFDANPLTIAFGLIIPFYILTFVLLPAFGRGIITLLRKNGLEYTFTNKRILLTYKDKPKSLKLAKQSIQIKNKRASNRLFNIPYKDISECNPELNKIKIRLKPSLKVFISGLHFLSLLGIPLTIHTLQDQAPKLASIIITHKNF